MKSLSKLVGLLLILLNVGDLQASDRCTPFDSWIGGERFALTVDRFGTKNFPEDTELSDKILFPQSSIWRYYSVQTDTAYVVIYLDTDVDLRDDARAGSQHVCAYRIAGTAMGGGKKTDDRKDYLHGLIS